MELKELFNAYLLLVTLALVPKQICSQSEEPPIRQTTKGKIQGRYQFSRENRKFASYEGIHYAKQPERFQPPEEPDSWDGIYNATEPGYQCPHFLPMTGTYFDDSEDCLTLNVVIPAQLESDANLTVMFWIHGGGYMFGSGSVMGPRYIMDEDVILVTTNYRLGAFGFLNSEDELVRGNMGFKDMIMALKWVQTNIAAFGGDPAKVTIFGESAGATGVHSLMLSPAAKGLFKKVIAQSGSALAAWNTMYAPAETFRILASALNCTASNNSVVLQCLKEAPILHILVAQSSLGMGSFSASMDPSPNEGDYSVFPQPFEKLFENGDNSRDVPLIIGRNDVESRGSAIALMNDDSFVDLANRNWTAGILRALDFTRFMHADDSPSRVSEAIRNFYFNGSQMMINDDQHMESLEQMLTDSSFLWSIKNSAILNAQYGAKVYPYTFLYQGNFSLADDINFPEEGRKRPCHADDLQYLFQSLQVPSVNWPDLEKGSEDEDFSKKFIKLWVSFATSADSTPDSAILGGEWKPIAKEKATLDSTIEWYLVQEKAVSQVETERLRDRVKFWNNIFDYNAAVTLSTSHVFTLIASIVVFSFVV